MCFSSFLPVHHEDGIRVIMCSTARVRRRGKSAMVGKEMAGSSDVVIFGDEGWTKKSAGRGKRGERDRREEQRKRDRDRDIGKRKKETDGKDGETGKKEKKRGQRKERRNRDKDRRGEEQERQKRDRERFYVTSAGSLVSIATGSKKWCFGDENCSVVNFVVQMFDSTERKRKHPLIRSGGGRGIKEKDKRKYKSKRGKARRTRSEQAKREEEEKNVNQC